MTLTGEKGDFEYCRVTGYTRQQENEHMKSYVRNTLLDHANRIDSLSQQTSPEAAAQLAELRSISGIHLKNKSRLDYSLQNPDKYVSVYEYSWFVKWLPEMVPKSHTASFFESLSDELRASTPGKQIKKYLDHVAVNRRLHIGDPPYDFILPDSTGTPVSLSRFKGKLVLLDFWAANCGPCRKEHVNYAKIYDEFKDDGFEIVSVSQDKRKRIWQNAMLKDKITWISLWDEDMTISKYTYLVSAIPNNYLIDTSGRIAATDLRGQHLYDFIRELLEKQKEGSL